MDNSKDPELNEYWRILFETIEKLCNRYNIILKDEEAGDRIAKIHPRSIVDLARLSVELEWRDRKYIENFEQR